MLRRVIAGLIVVGLAIGVWVLWPKDNRTNPSTMTVLAAEPTTPPPSSAPPTIASEQSTSTTLPDDHVVETVEEAEAILRELWFGWFEGIYNQDEARIREVVATDHQLRLATRQFGSMGFVRAPRLEDLAYVDTMLLRSDRDCLVVSTTAVIQGFTAAETTDVHVLRRTESGWRFFSLWKFTGDLWENDCDASLDS